MGQRGLYTRDSDRGVLAHVVWGQTQCATSSEKREGRGRNFLLRRKIKQFTISRFVLVSLQKKKKNRVEAGLQCKTRSVYQTKRLSSFLMLLLWKVTAASQLLSHDTENLAKQQEGNTHPHVSGPFLVLLQKKNRNNQRTHTHTQKKNM